MPYCYHFQSTEQLYGMSVRSASGSKTSQVICEEVFDEDSIATHDGRWFHVLKCTLTLNK